MNNLNDPLFEKTLREIQDEPIDAAQVERAAQRVWARVSQEMAPPAPEHAVEKIRSCADYQALLPAYRAGQLPSARRMLLEDHLHECVACRKVYEGKVIAFPAPAAAAPPAPRRAWWPARPAMQFAVAAALAVAVGITSWGLLSLGVFSTGSKAAVQAVDGRLFALAGGKLRAVKAGEELLPGAEIRTAKDSTAMIRLRDGSLVEMRERSAFRVTESLNDLTLHLARGSVIVEAAKRSRGHLYVDARDCRVAVTGTVFAVDAGIKGSRVSVVEGEVRVTDESGEAVLRPGDQHVTSAGVEKVPVQEEISWSRNVEKHVALLREFDILEQRLRSVQLPALRYGSKLLERLPASTVIYAAIPNVSRALDETYQIFAQRVQQSEVLREWWSGKVGAQAGAELANIVQEARLIGDYLGDEIVIAAALDSKGAIGAPVFVAELKRSGFREFVESELHRVSEGKRPPVMILEESVAGLEPFQKTRNEMLMVAREDVVIMSPRAEGLAIVARDGNGSFSGTPFQSRINEVYRAGAGLLIAVDMERIHTTAAGHMNERAAREMAAIGVTDLKYIVAEQREINGVTDTRAEMTFRGPRRGVFSWLGQPAPLSSLEFVSAEAWAATAVTIKQPAAIINEFLTMVGSNARAQQDLEKLERELGISIRDDIAGSLGAEATLAFDGPAVPVPAWKVVVEVYDPQRLQYAFTKIIEAGNREAAAHGVAPATFTQEQSGGRIYYHLVRSESAPLTEAWWTFADGYLIAAPQRPMLERAMQYRATGYNLARSASFRAMFPQDRHTNASAIVYQNMGTVVSSLADTVGRQAGNMAGLPQAQRQSVQQMVQNMKPFLVAAYGDEDRITVASQGSLFSVSPVNMLRMLSTGSLLEGLARKNGTSRR